MARSNTYESNNVHGYHTRRECIICGNESEKRVFYNPTYMNGDAEWLGDYCEEHKSLDWEKKIESGDIIGKYRTD